MVPFLVRVLDLQIGVSAVMDLGAGSGCDAIALAERGIRVIGNEVDPVLLGAARQSATRAGVDVEWQSLDWRTIGSRKPGSVQSAYLVGNSFCLLMDESHRGLASHQFARLLSPHGKLVVDERNFDYILRERSAILDGNFRYSRRVVYCGRGVSAVPSLIEDDRVVFSYFLTETGEFLGNLVMHPFRRGELVEAFARAGFRLLGEFSDLRRGRQESADFFSYVFQRAP
jgi:hypothetical protein